MTSRFARDAGRRSRTHPNQYFDRRRQRVPFTGLAVDVVTLNFCSRWMDEPLRRGCRDGLISGGLRPLPSRLPGISFGAFAMLHSVGVTATRHRVEKSSRWAGCDRKQLMFML